MSKAKLMAEGDGDEMAALPGPEDRLFEFTAQRPVTPSEFSRKQDWYFYINGYKDAADLLVSHAAEADPRKLGYSILFLYRQHLELALKALIRDCSGLVGRQEAFPKRHQIDKLWGICRGLLDELSPGKSISNEMQQTTRLIGEFCRLDPESETFRYPEDKSGNPYTLDVEIALSTVKEVVGKISLLLDCIAADISILKDDAS